MLTEIIPAEWRKAVYAAYAIGAVVLGVTGIVLQGYALDPQWYGVATDVWLYLGVAVGAVAASNTSTARHRADE